MQLHRAQCSNDPEALREEEMLPQRSDVTQSFANMISCERTRRLMGSRALCIYKRSDKYHEHRSDGYMEPLYVAVLASSHFHGATDVSAVATALEPDTIVVELCRSRSAVLSSNGTDATATDQSLPLALPSSVDEIARSLRLAGGPVPLLLQSLSASVTSRVIRSAGVVPAAEARAAKDAADWIHAEICLGDRPIEITLRRALDSLSFADRLKLALLLFRGLVLIGASPHKNELQQATQEANDWHDKGAIDTFKQQLSQLGRLKEVLLDERDMFIAWSSRRSKAVDNKHMVLTIVGAAHYDGVVHYVQAQSSSKLRLHEIADPDRFNGSKRNKSKPRKIVASFIRDTIIGYLVYLAWGWFNNPS